MLPLLLDPGPLLLEFRLHPGDFSELSLEFLLTLDSEAPRFGGMGNHGATGRTTDREQVKDV
jgi:hypothetical protein